jgi:hypothetical protein
LAFRSDVEVFDVRVALEEFVDGGAEGASAFAVDDANAAETRVEAFLYVAGDEVAEFVGAEGVEVEFAVDGEFDQVGFVGGHRPGLY